MTAALLRDLAIARAVFQLRTIAAVVHQRTDQNPIKCLAPVSAQVENLPHSRI